tara:strand:- start:176 stop:1126 length:951 start_codon:yes stop_codon:yes gene_type:complete
MKSNNNFNYQSLITDNEEEENDQQELIIRENNGERKNRETKEEREIKECRICFETELESDEIFINPCRCRGTSKWVHLSCLNRWRNEAININARTRCSECKTEYTFEINEEYQPEVYTQEYHRLFQVFYLIQALPIYVIVYYCDRQSGAYVPFLCLGFEQETAIEDYQESFPAAMVFYFNFACYILNYIIILQQLIYPYFKIKRNNYSVFYTKKTFIKYFKIIVWNNFITFFFLLGMIFDSYTLGYFFYSALNYWLVTLFNDYIYRTNELVLNNGNREGNIIIMPYTSLSEESSKNEVEEVEIELEETVQEEKKES